MPRSRSLLAILVTLTACADHDLETLTDVKTRMCACKTASCAEQELKQVPQTPIKSTQRSQALAQQMMTCLAKLQAAERPVTDPDAEGSEPEPEAAPAAPAPAKR